MNSLIRIHGPTSSAISVIGILVVILCILSARMVMYTWLRVGESGDLGFWRGFSWGGVLWALR